MENSIKFYRVKELREALQDLPEDRYIACQVIGAEKGAWNMWGEFCPLVKGGNIAVMQFKHDMLKVLPEYSDEGEIIKPLNHDAIPYQLCPKCSGNGQLYNPTGTSLLKVCDVCNGNKIILMHRP